MEKKVVYVKLPVEVLNKVLSMLAAEPYNQVADIIKEVHESVIVMPAATEVKTESDES